jgi:hypothetical protein
MLHFVFLDWMWSLTREGLLQYPHLTQYPPLVVIVLLDGKYLSTSCWPLGGFLWLRSIMDTNCCSNFLTNCVALGRTSPL